MRFQYENKKLIGQPVGITISLRKRFRRISWISFSFRKPLVEAKYNWRKFCRIKKKNKKKKTENTKIIKKISNKILRPCKKDFAIDKR